MCEGSGLPAHRPPRPQQLQTFIRIVDSMVAQHQVAESLQRPAVASADRVAQPDSGFQRMAAGPQRLYPSGPGFP
ncbi:MAG: hypothetical protein ACLRM9_10840 [Collinsella aerofaciens]